jgi:hypothetical protein
MYVRDYETVRYVGGDLWKDSSLSILLDQADFGGAEKKAVLESIDQLAERPVR